MGIVVAGMLASTATAHPNGPFGAPTFESYEALGPSTHGAYRRRYRAFAEDFYFTDRGKSELRSAALALWDRRDRYAHIYSVGRSGTGILSYLRALAASPAERKRFTDLPFSFGTKWDPVLEESRDTNAAERRGLRAHLRRNGLSPRRLADSPKPVLIYDFVYSATGVRELFTELHLWAAEENLTAEVKAKLHFFGFYVAEMRARETAISIWSRSNKEMGGTLPMPSDESIRQDSLSLTPPLEPLKDFCAELYWTRISSSHYHHAGTNGPTAHESFVREEWTGMDSKFEEMETTFAGRFDDPGFVALHYIFDLALSDQAAGDCTPRLVAATWPVRNFRFDEERWANNAGLWR